MKYEMGRTGHLVWAHVMSLITGATVELIESSAFPIKTSQTVNCMEASHTKSLQNNRAGKIEINEMTHCRAE